MEKYGLLDSPSFVSYSDNSSSEEDSYNLYKGMQRIPNVPVPVLKHIKPKRIFEKTSNVPKRGTLQEYLMKINHPLVTSTPLNDTSPANSHSLLKITPIPISRNSIITGRFVNYKHKLSRNAKRSLNNSVNIINGINTLSKSECASKRGVKNRKNQSKFDENTLTHDLDGIEPLNQTLNLAQPIQNKLIQERETQTTGSLNKSPFKYPNLRRQSETLRDGTNIQKSQNATSNIQGSGQKKLLLDSNLISNILTNLDASVNVDPRAISISSTVENSGTSTLQCNANFNSVGTSKIVPHTSQVPISGRILRSTSRLLSITGEVTNTNEASEAQPKRNTRSKKVIEASDCTTTHKKEAVNKTVIKSIKSKKSRRGTTPVNKNALDRISQTVVKAPDLSNNSIVHKRSKKRDNSHISVLDSIGEDNATKDSNESKTRKMNTDIEYIKLPEKISDKQNEVERSSKHFKSCEGEISQNIDNLSRLRENSFINSRNLEPNEHFVNMEASSLKAVCVKIVKLQSPKKTQHNVSFLETESKEMTEQINKNNVGKIMSKKKVKMGEEVKALNTSEVNEIVETNVKMTLDTEDDLNEKVPNAEQMEGIDKEIITKSKKNKKIKKTDKGTVSNEKDSISLVETNTTNNRKATKNKKGSKTSCVPIELQQYIFTRKSGFVEISESTRSFATDSEDTFRANGRLRRTIKPPKAYIQATIFSRSHLKKRSSTAKTKNYKRDSKMSNNNTTKVKNLEDSTQTQTIARTSNTDVSDGSNFTLLKTTRKRNNTKVSKKSKSNTTNTKNLETAIELQNIPEVDTMDSIPQVDEQTLIESTTSDASTRIVKKKGNAKASIKKSDNTKSKNCENSSDAEIIDVDTSIPPFSGITEHRMETNNSESSKSKEVECFKKPKGRAIRNPKAQIDTSNLQRTSFSVSNELNDTHSSLGSDRAFNVIASINNAGIPETNACVFNSVDSKTTSTPAGQDKTGVNFNRVENVSANSEYHSKQIVVLQNETISPANILSHNNEVMERRFTKKFTFNDDETTESTNTEKKRKKCKEIIQGVVDNRAVMLEWYSDKPRLDDSQTVNVVYSLTNLKSHMGIGSCGYITFGPGQEKSQVPKKHVITFKVEKGRALVSQQFVTKVMETNATFYIPLGSPYKIKNLSNSESLVLYFVKMAEL